MHLHASIFPVAVESKPKSIHPSPTTPTTSQPTNPPRPQPPTDRGQGLNHCIADISHLVYALQDVQSHNSSLQDAVAAYEDEMVKRGAEEVRSSLQNSLMLHDW